MTPMESADVIIENLPGDTPDTTIINKHEFTETIGYIALAGKFKKFVSLYDRSQKKFFPISICHCIGGCYLKYVNCLHV